MLKNKFLFILLSTFYFLLSAFPSLASSVSLIHNPHYLISDLEFADANSMNQITVQEFLEIYNSKLASLNFEDTDGKTKSASEIIFLASQDSQISPKVLLTILQKEQSLIADSNPSQRQLDFATGYGCLDGAGCLEAFRGFAKQIRYTSQALRKYLEDIATNGTTISGWKIGQAKTTGDGFAIIPLSAATAALYTYTPWRGDIIFNGRRIGGNFSFFNLWQKWFAKIFPDGSLLQEEGNPVVWLIEKGQRRPFLSKGALLSRFLSYKIISVKKGELLKFELGQPIKFPQYSLLRSLKGTIYLLVDDLKRRIVSPEVFRTIGFNPEEIIQVEENELSFFADGKPITLEDSFPKGALLQDAKTGGVYFVKEGAKHPIWDRKILNTNFAGQRIIPVNSTELEKFPTKEPIKFKDTALLKNSYSPVVFVISNGQRRAIANEQTFESLGYKWQDIIIVNDKILALHALSEPVELPLDEEAPVTVISSM